MKNETNFEKILLFFLGLVGATLVGVVCLSPQLSINDSYRLLIIKIFCTILILSWGAVIWYLKKLDEGELDGSIFVYMSIVLLMMGPIALMSFEINQTLSNISFWISLIISVVAGTLLVLNENKFDPKPVQRVPLVLSTIWSISLLIISVGNSKIFSYSAKAIEDLKIVFILLDIRIIISIAFFGYIATVGISRAFKEPPPEIPQIQIRRIDHKKKYFPGIWQSLFSPFLILADSLIFSLNTVVNVVWLAFAYICVYLYRIGHQILIVLIDIFNKNALKAIFKTLLIFFAALIAFKFCSPISQKILSYIQTNAFISELKLLMKMLIDFSIILICVLLITWVIDKDKENLKHAFFGLSTILVVLLLAGWILFVVGRYKFLGLNSFALPGIFTLSLSSVALFGFVKTFFDN